MIGSLNGKVALVTGAGSGIGRGVVERYLEEGAKVAAFDLSGERLEALKSDVGGSIVTVRGDASAYEDNARAVAVTVNAFGRLDVLVANAGVYDNGVKLEDMSAEILGQAFDEIFDVNVKGYLFGIKAALAELKRSRGNIILTASISSLVAGFGGALYVPAKHAILGISRQLAYELAPDIRVNAVAAGYVASKLSAAKVLEDSDRGLADPESATRRIPLGVAPQPGDFAGVYVLLASKRDGCFITGSTVLIDSGQVLTGPPS